MPDISSGVPIGDPTMGSMGGGGSQSAMPQGTAGPVGPNAQMLKIMGPIALAYLQNMMQQSMPGTPGGAGQSQQDPSAGGNQPGDPVTEAMENATGQDLDGDQDGTGVQSAPPGGKSLQTAHANQPNNGTIPLGTVGQQGMAMPKGIGGTGGMPFVRGRQPGGSSTKVSGGRSSVGGHMGGRGSKAKPPPVGKIKTPPKEGKTPPPA